MDELNDWLPDREEGDGTHRAEDEDREEGCCFPGECCMPGPHFRHECHTPQMVRDLARSTRL